MAVCVIFMKWMAERAKGETRGILYDHKYLLWGLVLCHDLFHFLLEAHRMHLNTSDYIMLFWLFYLKSKKKKNQKNKVNEAKFFPSSLYSPLRALKQNWLQVLLRVTLWRSAQTPKYASAVAVTETSPSGTFTIRLWYDNSRGTQMAPVVLTSRPMAPNCGPVVWTTRSALGISER